MQYGEAIRLLREAAGITQTTLAEALGMSAPRLCEREASRVEATRDEYERAEEHLLRIVGERRQSLRQAMDEVRAQLPTEAVA